MVQGVVGEVELKGAGGTLERLARFGGTLEVSIGVDKGFEPFGFCILG